MANRSLWNLNLDTHWGSSPCGRAKDWSLLCFFAGHGSPLVKWERSLNLKQKLLVIMTWNLMHLALLLKSQGGFPSGGNSRAGWDSGDRFGFSHNPEYR